MNYKKRVGDFGEKLAIEYLQKKKYKIINRNVKLSYQEIDIIAKIKTKTIFIEVKTRTNLSVGIAEEAINYYKIKNIKKAMLSYIYLHKLDIDNTQFDVIVVNIDKIKKIAKIKHYLSIL